MMIQVGGLNLPHADTTPRSDKQLSQLHQHNLDLRPFDAAANSFQDPVAFNTRAVVAKQGESSIPSSSLHKVR
jgi:hypothetical protein